MSNIGMMDGAFFVGRKEIIDWVNETLGLNLSQLLDIMNPGQVPMHKVNWAANKDFEYIANYKLLQNSFSKLSIDRFVDVDRLIKGRYQDNLEFMQWFKRFFEMSARDIASYDAVAQRARGKGGAQYTAQYGSGSSSAARAESSAPPSIPRAFPVEVGGGTGTGAQPSSRSTASGATTTATAAGPAKRTVRKTTEDPAPPPAVPESTRASRTAPAAKSTGHTGQHPPPATAPQKRNLSSRGSPNAVATKAEDGTLPLRQELDRMNGAYELLESQYADLKSDMDGLEKEKEFYFDKLRDIEMMLQDLKDSGQGSDLTDAIFNILYATADGFQSTEGGEGAAQQGPGSVGGGREAVVEGVEDESSNTKIHEDCMQVDDDLETY